MTHAGKQVKERENNQGHNICLERSWNPQVWPAYLMTDCDQAQIAALETVFPQGQVLLGTWHVLHAIQSHCWTDHFPELWALIKKLVSTPHQANFNQIFDKILSNPAFPQSFQSIFQLNGSRWPKCSLELQENCDLSIRKTIQICCLRGKLIDLV